MRLLVLGASGGIGRAVLAEAEGRGWAVVAQTRTAPKLADWANRAEILEGDPRDGDMLERGLAGADAAVFALGVDGMGPTALFSEATRALIGAMRAADVWRLVAVTGVGAGETRGHGGFFYDRIIFPLFTRRRYADKDRQEAIIADSPLDWTIVRPAAFARKAGPAPMEVHEIVAPDLTLRSVTRAEVATFICDCVEHRRFVHARPFIGRP